MTLTDEMIEAAAIAIYEAYINDPVQYDDVKASSEVMARAAITAVLPLLQQDWQPIETAPKDGTEILAVSDEGGTGIMIIRYISLQDFITTADAEEYANQGMSQSDLECEDWFYADFIQGGRLAPDCQPSHWMPLPEPPKTKE